MFPDCLMPASGQIKSISREMNACYAHGLFGLRILMSCNTWQRSSARRGPNGRAVIKFPSFRPKRPKSLHVPFRGGMKSLSLAILYTPTCGRPLRVATIADERLLIEAARAAIQEAESRAAQLSLQDSELSKIEEEEAIRLRGIFTMLLVG